MNSYLFTNPKGKEYAAPAALAPLADTHTHLFLGKNYSPLELIEHASATGVRLLGVPIDPVDFNGGRFQFVQESKRTEKQSSADPEHHKRKQYQSKDPHRKNKALLVRDPISQEQHGKTHRFQNSFLAFLEDRWALWQRTLPDASILSKTTFICGVHPFGASEFSTEIQTQLEEALSSPLVRAVGEIGLDYTCDIDPQLQQKVFIIQLKMAQEAGLSVELHIRDARDDASFQAHADARAILEKYGVPKAGADLHCFTGDTEMLFPYLDLECLVAFGGAATFAKDDAIREAACACPAEQLLSETDSPFMAPVPLRGTECEPAMVSFVAACLAQVREDAGVATKQETYDALWSNANRFFNFE